MNFYKICGITTPAIATLCRDLAVPAIGCVFHENSPRHVTQERARSVTRAAGPDMLTVAVFVNPAPETAIRIGTECGFQAIQLHGPLVEETARQIRKAGLSVIQKISPEDLLDPDGLRDFPADAFLVEGATGPLPGGNGVAWDWPKTGPSLHSRPILMAGGITVQNATLALLTSQAFGLDLSSGVESSPGKKNPARIEALVRLLGPRNPEHALFPLT